MIYIMSRKKFHISAVVWKIWKYYWCHLWKILCPERVLSHEYDRGEDEEEEREDNREMGVSPDNIP